MQDVIIVTGACSGIGSEVTEELASRGYTVLAIAPREKLLRRLYSFNDNVIPVVADLSKDEDLKKIQAWLEEEHSTIKCLIHSSMRRYPIHRQQQVKTKHSSTLKLTKKLQPFFDHTKVILVNTGTTPIQKTRQESIYHNLKDAFNESDVKIDLIRSGQVKEVIAEVEH